MKNLSPGTMEITSEISAGDVLIDFEADAELIGPAGQVDLWLTIAHLAARDGSEGLVAAMPYYLSDPESERLHLGLVLSKTGPGYGAIKPLRPGRYLARLIAGNTILAKGEFRVSPHSRGRAL